MSAYITEYEGRYFTSKTLPRLCQNLVNKGLNIPNHEFLVKNFDTSEEIALIHYDAVKDVWMQYIPEKVKIIPASTRAIRMTEGLRNNIPQVRK